MVEPAPPLIHETAFEPQTGTPVPVGPALTRLTAPNAGPYTFTGTNSFLIGEERLFVLDPGPDNPAHESALRRAIGDRPVEAVLLTHTHRDHSALARRLGAALGAPLWFAGPHKLSRPLRPGARNPVGQSSDWALQPDRVLADGERIAVGGVTLETVATPGHCANHIGFRVVGSDVLFSGDHVMGWNTTLVSTPDGSMADYLASLDKLLDLPCTRYLPAHGGEIADGPARVRALKAHRLARNAQILEAVGEGARSVAAITRVVYPGLSARLVPAARMTVAAHVDYLEALGALTVRRGPFGARIALSGQGRSGG